MVHVRRIRPDEGTALKEIRLRSLALAPHAFARTLAEESPRSDVEWDADAARWATASAEGTFFAELDGEIVGMVGVFIENGRGELVAMWTDPAARHQGIARRLIDAVGDWCRVAGVTELDTGFAAGNEAAATLYRSAGFTATGEERPLGQDRVEHRLSKSLTERVV